MSSATSTMEGRMHQNSLTEYDLLLPGKPANDVSKSADPRQISTLRSAIVILSLAGVTFASSISTGLLAVGLPVIADDVQLPVHLLLWPSSVYSLASGCCLLLAGSIADLVGDRIVNLIGTLILGLFILASGLASNGPQLILFRGIQGIGVSMCLPTSVSIMTRSFPRGRLRTFGFSCLGLAQPLGFSIGLIAEALLETQPGRWRLGWYTTAGVVFVFAQGNFWALPSDKIRPKISVQLLADKIDLVGVLLAATCLGGFSYVAAVLNQDAENMHQLINIALLVTSITLAPVFVKWMARQERKQRPALIPNSLWANKSFATICIMVLCSWAVLQSSDLFFSLFFQKVQKLPPVQVSLNFLPNIIVGVIINPLTGLFIQHVSAYHLLVVSSIIATLSPVAMIIIDPRWSFWSCAFWAVLLSPVSVDVVFTVAHLIITDAFPADTHALAGAVFNTVAQLGCSIGLSVMAVISHYVTKTAKIPDKSSPEALMKGYRAAFWAAFVIMVLSCISASTGLRELGTLGSTSKEEGYAGSNEDGEDL